MAGSPIKKRALIWILGGALLIVLIAAVIVIPKIQNLWTTPLGPGLGLSTRTPTIASPTDAPPELPSPSADAASESANTTTPSSPTLTPLPTLTFTPTPAPLCGGPPVMTLLGIGADNRSDNYLYGLADVIRLARVDFITPKVTVLSIPRDLWVEIPEISDHYGITHGKLNQAYLYGGPGMGYYDGPGGGPGLLARTLDLNFGFFSDHYGAVNMLTFVKIVNAVGGIDVYLPTDVDGTPIDEKTEDMGYFYAGNNHFSGEQALRFVRVRKRYNDMTRMDHQTMVLCALREKLLSPSVLPKIPEIISSFSDSIVTDLTPQQIGQLACLLPQVPRENLIFTGFPDEIFTPGREYSQEYKDYTFVLKVDNAVIRDYFAQFMAGEWPTEPDEPSCP